MTDETIFTTALEKPHGPARAAYLRDTCADAAQRARIEALLAAVARAGSFLERPAAGAPADPDFTPTMTFGTDTSAADDERDALAFLAPAGRPDSLGRIGHYEVMQVLGRGAFGVVYRAFDDVLQRVVAVKVLSPQMAATSPARKRFLREARTSAAVRHENVVQVYEVGEQPLPYLVMEFIPGETLQARLDRTGPLDATEVVRVGRQIAEGLAAAHGTDLVHRDIKPGNILLEGGNQRVKITDFGLARAADDASISQSGIIAGTPMYMAPEQAKGEHIDHRADLFSLGSVLYQMLSGRPPFRASTTLAVLKRVADDDPRPIREIIPEAPQWLCDIVARLHAKDPAQRFQSAREVADLLAECEARLKSSGEARGFPKVVPPVLVSEGAPTPAGARRPQWKWAAAGALIVGVLVSVAVLLPQMMKDRTRERAKGEPESPPVVTKREPKLEPKGEPVPEPKREPPKLEPPPPGPPPVAPPTIPPKLKEPNFAFERATAEQVIAVGGWVKTVQTMDTSIRKAGDLPRGPIVVREIHLGDLVKRAQTVDLPRYKDCARLRALFLTNTGVKREQLDVLRDFPALQTLCLSKTAADDSWVPQIAACEHLKYLYLIETKLSPAGIEALRTALPECTLRVVRNTDIAPRVPPFGPDLKPLPIDALDHIGTLPPLEQVEAVRRILVQRNPKFDGALAPTVEGNVVVKLELWTDNVSDLMPLRALTGLKALSARGTEGKGKLTNLSPLKGLPLTVLDVNNNGQLTDLAPLKALPLKQLFAQNTAVRDLAPLAGLRLTELNLSAAPIADLAPLKDMPLVTLYLDSTKVESLTPLRGMPLKQLNIRELKLTPARDHAVLRTLFALESINSESVADFWKAIGPKEVPPFTDADAKRIAALPANDQIEAVREELKKRNPKFDGKFEATLDGATVARVHLVTDNVTDVSPLRGFSKLSELHLDGGLEPPHGALTDISPLKGMPLTVLYLFRTKVTDLTPLRGVPLRRLEVQSETVPDLAPVGELRSLEYLSLGGSQLRDIKPLAGLKLKHFHSNNSAITDITPLKGMPLTDVTLHLTPVADLSPLKGAPLKYLNLESTNVSDLSPLKGAPITQLIVRGTKVTDTAALKTLPLNGLFLDYKPERDAEHLRAIETLEIINDKPAKEFLKKNDTK